MAPGSFGPTAGSWTRTWTRSRRGRSMVMLVKGNRRAGDARVQETRGFYLGSIGGPAAILARNNIKKVEVLEYPGSAWRRGKSRLGFPASSSSTTRETISSSDGSRDGGQPTARPSTARAADSADRRQRDRGWTGSVASRRREGAHDRIRVPVPRVCTSIPDHSSLCISTPRWWMVATRRGSPVSSAFSPPRATLEPGLRHAIRRDGARTGEPRVSIFSPPRHVPRRLRVTSSSALVNRPPSLRVFGSGEFRGAVFRDVALVSLLRVVPLLHRRYLRHHLSSRLFGDVRGGRLGGQALGFVDDPERGFVLRFRSSRVRARAAESPKLAKDVVVGDDGGVEGDAHRLGVSVVVAHAVVGWIRGVPAGVPDARGGHARELGEVRLGFPDPRPRYASSRDEEASGAARARGARDEGDPKRGRSRGRAARPAGAGEARTTDDIVDRARTCGRACRHDTGISSVVSSR